MVKLKKIYCKNCNKGFYRSAGRLNEAEKFGWNHYCSKKCEYKYKTKKYTFVCKNCGKKFKKWLTENKISHEKDAPYPTTKHKADWSIGSKKIFIEYFGLAEDSPRYDRSITKKRTLCHKHKIKLIEIYSQDLYPKIN